MADRYTGRHKRQVRHGAWLNKKRSRSRQLLPAAAALGIAGILIGGGSLVIKYGSPTPTAGIESASSYDAADYPPADRDAQVGRVSREEIRPTPIITMSPVVPAPATSTKLPAAKTGTSSAPLQGNAAVISTGSCQASFYDEGQQTANGETFDPTALTAAHKTLPFNTKVRVTNVANGKSVVVRINDRGPYVSGRCLDLSSAAFSTIASLGAGVATVKYEVLGTDGT